VTVQKVTYDPAADPKNKGGFNLLATRSPTDPKAAARKPMTIAALYDVPSVADPRWSPDGKQILFTVTRHNLKAGKSNAEIYRVNADGSDLRRMTHHDGADTHPRWAPDGRSFLFLSARGGKLQVWRMPVDGGEPEQLTHLATGAGEPEWTPDGSRVVFTSRVFPEFGADDAKNAARLKAMKKSPLRAYMADELLYRHWTAYRSGRRTHLLALRVKGGAVTDLTPGDFESPAFSLGGGGFDISPDGKEVCFESNRDAPSARAWTTNKDLWVAPISGGPAKNLTDSNEAFDGDPHYAPNGSAIAYLRQERPGYESDLFSVALYDRKAGTSRVITGGLKNWVMDMRWTPDSEALVLKVAEKGRFPLYRLNVKSGKLTRLALPAARQFALSSRGRLAFTYSRVDRPAELFTAKADGTMPRRLTFFSKAVVETYDLRPAEELWFEGADGKKVHTFIVKPHGFQEGKRYPIIVNVHGGPQYQWTDRFRGDWQVYTAKGYVVAFPNPHGSIGYGQAYTAAISKDWGGKVYEDVMKVTDALAKLPYVDETRMGAMGWSYGGYMMDWILGHTTRFKALCSMMGVYDLVAEFGATEELWFPEWDVGGTPWDHPDAYRKWSPSTYAKNFATPTLVMTGEKDYRVPYTQSLELFTALRRRGVPARLIVLPNDGHWPSWVKSMPLYYAAHLDWFHRYLGGGPSPWDIKKLVQGGGYE